MIKQNLSSIHPPRSHLHQVLILVYHHLASLHLNLKLTCMIYLQIISYLPICMILNIILTIIMTHLLMMSVIKHLNQKIPKHASSMLQNLVPRVRYLLETIRRVMSKSSTRFAHVAHLEYHVSFHKASSGRHLSLGDRRANGGVAGDDIRIIFRTRLLISKVLLLIIM
jgi:hypothetical protein